MPVAAAVVAVGAQPRKLYQIKLTIIVNPCEMSLHRAGLAVFVILLFRRNYFPKKVGNSNGEENPKSRSFNERK